LPRSEARRFLKSSISSRRDYDRPEIADKTLNSNLQKDRLAIIRTREKPDIAQPSAGQTALILSVDLYEREFWKSNVKLSAPTSNQYRWRRPELLKAMGEIMRRRAAVSRTREEAQIVQSAISNRPTGIAGRAGGRLSPGRV